MVPRRSKWSERERGGVEVHVVITGASSGIGEALAREWSAAGAQVTLVARRTALLETLAASLPGRSHLVTADLSQVDRCTDWLAGAIDALGPIDVLINNAGVQIVEPFEAGELAAHERLIRVNLLAPMWLTRAALPAMIERGSGAVVNVASLAAIAPTPFMGSYNASKAGLAGWSEALGGELRKTGVHVVTVYPGPVKTAMADSALEIYGDGAAQRLPVGNTTTLAQRVRRAVERRQARVIYPRLYSSARYFPGLTRVLLDRLTPSLRK